MKGASKDHFLERREVPAKRGPTQESRGLRRKSESIFDVESSEEEEFNLQTSGCKANEISFGVEDNQDQDDPPECLLVSSHLRVDLDGSSFLKVECQHCRS